MTAATPDADAPPAAGPGPPTWRRPLERAGAALGPLVDNPILVKELRGAFRRRLFLFLHTGLLTLVALVLIVTLFVLADVADADPSRVGRETFLAFLAAEAVLVFLVFPASACTSIVEEHTNKSFDLLVTTRLRPASITWGKFLAALVYGLTFVASTLPLVALTFLYGGVTPGQIACAYAGLLVVGLVSSSYGLLISSLAASSTKAVVRTFLVLPAVGLLVLSPVGWLVQAFVVAPLAGGRGATDLRDAILALGGLEQALLYVGAAAWSAAWVALFLILATNRIKPARANRDTAVRLWLLVTWGTALALTAVWVLTTPSLSASEVAAIPARAILGTVSVLLLATLALVVDDPQTRRAHREGRWGEGAAAGGAVRALARRLLLPGAQRAAAFLLALAGLTFLVVGLLLAPSWEQGPSGGWRAPAEVVTWGFGWGLCFLLTVTQGAVFLSRRLGPLGTRLSLGGVLLAVSIYPMLWFHADEAWDRGDLYKGYFLSPYTVAISALSRPPNPLRQRQLVLLGPSGAEIEEALQARDEELVAAPGFPTDPQEARRALRRERKAFAEELRDQGVSAHRVALVVYLLAGVGLLGLNLRGERSAPGRRPGGR